MTIEEKDEDMEKIEKPVVDDTRVVDPPAEGSSRVTGGFLRGKAMGNVLNLADSPDLLVDVPIPAKGVVRLYSDLSHQPSINNPTMTLKTEAKPTLGPILEKLARSYSPVKSKGPHNSLS